MDFSKDSRLLIPADFLYLKTESECFRSQSFLAFFKPSRHQKSYSRLGLAVSRKAGNAVRRNRFKRMLRERFRESQLRTLPLDILVVMSRPIDKNFANKDLSDEQVNLHFSLLEKFILRRQAG